MDLLTPNSPEGLPTLSLTVKYVNVIVNVNLCSKTGSVLDMLVISKLVRLTLIEKLKG